jgi:hypothetical protein
MSFNKGDGGIQFKRTKVVEFNYLDVIAAGSGAFFGVTDIPPQAVILGGGLMITQVFNSTSSDTFVIEDSSATPNQYKTSINGQALGYTALTDNGKQISTLAMQTIGLTWTPGSGTPTTGIGYLIIEYFLPNLSDEYYTLSDPIAP